jgi:hypothetical protein
MKNDYGYSMMTNKLTMMTTMVMMMMMVMLKLLASPN